MSATRFGYYGPPAWIILVLDIVDNEWVLVESDDNNYLKTFNRYHRLKKAGQQALLLHSSDEKILNDLANWCQNLWDEEYFRLHPENLLPPAGS